MLHPLRESAASVVQAERPLFTLPPPVPRGGQIPQLSHLVWSMDAEHGEAGSQNRDDALNQGKSRDCYFCIILDNEA